MSYRDGSQMRKHEFLFVLAVVSFGLVILLLGLMGMDKWRRLKAEERLDQKTAQVEQPAGRETNSVLEIYSNTYGDRLMCMEGYGEVRVYQGGNQVVYDTPAGKVFVTLMPIVNRPAKECDW